MKPLTSIHATLITLALTASAPAVAGVQFRISHETSSNEYVVYMTPDAVPTPDMVLSAQVSLVVPRSTDGNGFVINSLKSAVKGISWVNHSQVKAPTENRQADYLSFGLLYSGGRPPAFGWQAGKEQRIFSFTSPSGCVPGVALLENSDPFSQLPNSVNTNPGNEFTNVGWLGGNAYTGNYGGAVQCGTAATLPEPIISAIPACEKNAAKLGGISRQIQMLSTLLNKLSVSTQRTNLQQQLDELRTALKCS
ncbi:hypothetical protein HMY34_11150 [Thiothrix subterranea]|uniref:hypothetical protein n=1 Tax=Thiothrix subterranea TaxID=2735563 RepID=UPI00192B1CC7|nr:hypothetical protein [Thiothrix subterranea]QQZ29282.1 hypothetical protein HMY34_11150 [Thiothrix subterranea]